MEALTENMGRGEIIISPMFGENSDWYRNVRAGGLIEVRRDGEGQPDGVAAALRARGSRGDAAYRDEHPVYSRMIPRMLVGIHGLEGDPEEACSPRCRSSPCGRPEGRFSRELSSV